GDVHDGRSDVTHTSSGAGDYRIQGARCSFGAARAGPVSWVLRDDAPDPQNRSCDAGSRDGGVRPPRGRRARQRKVALVATERELSREQLAEVFLRAPAFMATLRGPDHVFETANPAYYRLVGERELIGRPVR